MAIYNQPNLTNGVDDALISIGQEVPAFPIGILLFTFLIVLLGGAASQQRKTGYADWPLWTLLASLSIFLMSLIMTINVGLIDIGVLGIVIAINILAGFWYFMSAGRNEA